MKLLFNGKALIVGKEDIKLDDYPDLKVIGCNMTSVEHLPLEECEKRGIKVISLKGEAEFLKDIDSTAEHTIGLMIALLRNYKTAFHPPYKERDFYKGHTLSGKTLGLIGGDGRVGKQVAKIAKVFGMRVLIYEKDEPIQNLYNILKEVDVVSIHIELLGNEGFFTKEMFQQMKLSAYLINTSRDGVIGKGALKWALENKVIAGVAVDFIDDLELVEYAKTYDNLILTNHQGGNTFEDRAKTEEFITRKVEEYLQKGNFLV